MSPILSPHLIAVRRFKVPMNMSFCIAVKIPAMFSLTVTALIERGREQKVRVLANDFYLAFSRGSSDLLP
jgi:hypothetical protein